MKRLLRPEWFVRLWILLCAMGIVMAVWNSALAQDNAPATNAPPAAAAVVNQLGRDLVQSYRSTLTFGLDRVEVLQGTFLGHAYWEYLAMALYMVLAFYVSKFVDWTIKTRLKAWAAKTATKWDDVLVGLVDGPVKVITFVVLFHIGLQLFQWNETFEHFISRVTFILVAGSLVYVLLKAVDAMIGVWKVGMKDDGDRAFNVQFLLLVGKLAKVVICVVAFLTLLQNLGVNITAILGSVSVLGLAFGLAAQDTVANLFGAVAVFMDKPFKVGDRIKVGTDVDGTVEEMGLRATRVRTLEGFLVTVPNKTVGNNTVTNIAARPTIRFTHAVGITYDTPAPKVRRAIELLEEIYRAHPFTHDVIVRFDKFGDFFLNLNILWWSKERDWAKATTALQELNLSTKERFDAEGIEFAFPTSTIHLKQGG